MTQHKTVDTGCIAPLQHVDRGLSCFAGSAHQCLWERLRVLSVLGKLVNLLLLSNDGHIMITICELIRGLIYSVTTFVIILKPVRPFKQLCCCTFRLDELYPLTKSDNMTGEKTPAD